MKLYWQIGVVLFVVVMSIALMTVVTLGAVK